MFFRYFFCSIFLLQGLFADFLLDKVQNFAGESVFQVNRNFIDRLFENREAFFRDGVLDNKKILETLKNNGLLNLKFDAPKEVSIMFSSHTSPIFLLRSVNSTLASMGYSYFEVKKAEYNEGVARIVFSFMSEYMIDPLIVIDEMNKRGYIFNNISRINMQAWEYDVNLLDSKLPNAHNVEIGDNFEIKEVSGEYWLQTPDVSGNMNIIANTTEWHPKIIFFDKNLHIIDILKKEESLNNLTFNILKEVRFILVSDNQNPIVLKNGIKVMFSSFK
ncbi:putative hypothetical periplasmic protein [Helicobacter mustelae 12198]|uniref:Putative hypothetical periplasmic protein n=1 Tax=Helicobacter mustelae (strain ATCC 43772 / CCUG 25715 / CIP 103759 / LMG 18044 / NCTC 12198 / R85-136P) TaxID=679897 RepID=D3UHI3_HELM1|nr:hypothetical protein [Helicobacter mustelae]CBG39955.1 putative hypothetical periplasmic protein [Helicobacter mustelae 12198]